MMPTLEMRKPRYREVKYPFLVELEFGLRLKGSRNSPGQGVGEESVRGSRAGPLGKSGRILKEPHGL